MFKQYLFGILSTGLLLISYAVEGAIIVDTGTPSNSHGVGLGNSVSGQVPYAHAVRVTLNQNTIITEMKAFMSARWPDLRLHVTVYRDGFNSQIPDKDARIWAALFTPNQAPFGKGDWSGVENLHLYLKAGIYWFSFENWPGDRYWESLLCQAPREAEARAFYDPENGRWLSDSTSWNRIGVRILGDIAAPPIADLIALEVIQCVQDWTNSIDLIENKPTLIRTHLRAKSSGMTRVAAQLRGFRDETELQGSPLGSVNPAGFVEVDSDSPERREFINSSLNFRLPPDWIKGTVRLELDAGGTVDFKEYQEASGGTKGDGAVEVTFKEAKKFDIKLVAVKWRQPTGEVVVPTREELYRAAENLMAIYPVGQYSVAFDLLDITDLDSLVFLDRRPTMRIINSKLAAKRAMDGEAAAAGTGILYFGAFKDINWGGLANGIPGTVACGVISPNSTTLPHELGHCLGRHHSVHSSLSTPGQPKTGPCGSRASELAPDYPYIAEINNEKKALLGPMNEGPEKMIYGYDPVTGWVVSPTTHFDLMSYCQPRWISGYTYEGISAAINTTSSASPAMSLEGERVLIRGILNFDEGTGSFEPLLKLTSGTVLLPVAGDYTLEMRNANGLLTDSVAFEPSIDQENDLPGEPNTGSFIFPVLYDPAVVEYRIVYHENVLMTTSVSGFSPSVEVVYPNGNEQLQGDQAIIIWSGSDGDEGDVLKYSVQYSSDGGANWNTLAVDLETTEYQADLRYLAGGSDSIVRVIVTDGFQSASDCSDAHFTVRKNAPEVMISSPVEAIYAFDQVIVLDATGYDVEDRDLSAESFNWSSDVDGDLISGPFGQIKASDLSEGYHVLTVQVADSDGQQASASVPIWVSRIDGDVNGDGTANLVDLTRLAYQWFTAECQEGNQWCNGCDLDQNGQVDLLDLSIVIGSWLERVHAD